MSHFSRLKTRMMSRELLLKALSDLGYRYECGTLSIRGFGGNRTEVDIRVRTKRPGYDIGFRRVGDAYEIVADWWGISETTEEKFASQVLKRYAYHAARAALEQDQNFEVASETEEADGTIRLVLRRMR